MKKITFALCAFAFALTGLLASCSNESTSADFIDRGNAKHEYKYAVYGTQKQIATGKALTSSYTESLIDIDISKLSKDGKEEAYTAIYNNTFKDGYLTLSWETDENCNSNAIKYTLKGTAVEDGSHSRTKTYDGKVVGTSSASYEDLLSPFDFTFYDVDGVIYMLLDGDMVKMETLALSEDEDAFSGEFGGEFSLNYKIVNEKFANHYTDEDDGNLMKDANYSKSTIREYKLNFVPVESFDPEDIEIEE